MMNRVTEAEATNSFCPLLGRDCKGSHCMAWRWEDEEFHIIQLHRGQRTADGSYDFSSYQQAYYDERIKEGYEFVSATGTSVVLRKARAEPRTGFCGHFEPKVAEIES